MSIYLDGTLYGSGSFYGPSSVDVLTNLNFYRTSQDGIYVFWWGFSSAFISPALFTFDYELQLDTVPTFDSPNLVDFTSGLAFDTTQSIPFHVTEVVNSTHLVVDSTAGMLSGDTISQTNTFGVFTTTITTVTDGTHLVVGSTTNWIATTVITFQNGNVVKGYAVPVAARIDKVEQTWYARVRVIDGLSNGDWSFILIWTIPAKQQQQFAENLMNSLPDYHVYGKGDLLKPVNQRNSNLYLVDNMYGNQLDTASYENFLTQSDNYIYLCVDEDLYQNFGVLFNFPKPTSMQYVDYRWILINLIVASLVGSTNSAISNVVAAFTGISPILTDVRDENDFFLNTIQDPPIVPHAPTTVFHTSQPFISGTLVVEQLSTLTVGSTTGFVVGTATDTTDSPPVSFQITSIDSSTQLGISSVPHVGGQTLNPGDTIVQGVNTTTISVVTPGGLVSSGSYTTNPVQGTWTMSSPTTDTLQATFNVGTANDPIPLVFNGTDYTLESGTATYTHGSIFVTGVGTSFTTQLLVGDQITDVFGIYIGTIHSITDNTHLTFVNPWFGPTETSGVYKLNYTDIQIPPPINWDAGTLAAGIIIRVLNPGLFLLNHALIEMLGNLILPAEVKSYYIFE